MHDLKADGALEELRRFFGPLRFFDLQLGLVVPAVEFALFAVGANRQLWVQATTLK